MRNIHSLLFRKGIILHRNIIHKKTHIFHICKNSTLKCKKRQKIPLKKIRLKRLSCRILQYEITPPFSVAKKFLNKKARDFLPRYNHNGQKCPLLKLLSIRSRQAFNTIKITLLNRLFINYSRADTDTCGTCIEILPHIVNVDSANRKKTDMGERCF